MKIQTVLIASLPALFLTACSTAPVPGAYQKEIRAQGYTAYSHPIGDTQNVKDWDKFGPGVILRAKEQTYYEPARTLLGESGPQDAMKPENASPVGLFSNKTVSGYDFDGKGGWTLDAVNKIAGSVQFKKDTTVDVQFGKAYLANFKSEGEIHRAVRAALPNLDATTQKALRRGDFSVVQNAVYTDSVRYTFKQATQSGGSATYELSAQEIAALTAKGYKIVQGGVEVSQPTFIAYTPLLGAADDVSKK